MRKLIFIFVLTLVLFSACTKDSTPAPVDSIPSCVLPEVSTDTISSEGIFEKGNQPDGFAKGMKMDKLFEAGAEAYTYSPTNLNYRDSTLNLFMETFWQKKYGEGRRVETFILRALPAFRNNTCYPLTNTINQKDSIYIMYRVGSDDTVISWYKLDTKADNMLEVLDIDFTKKRVKAKFKATFVSKNNFLPEFPQRVRFSDVYIEAGY